jgi:DNA-binding response OmpR family regulator
LESKKILIIDDDFQVRRLIIQSCSRMGVEAHEAARGGEGLRCFYAIRPDLVILDILMPEMDGWEVCRQIRLLSDVPIIMLTSLDKDEDIIRGLDCGADDFVSKPFAMDVLMARVRAALRRQVSQPASEDAIFYSDGVLLIDTRSRQVRVSGKPVLLTAKEYRLLEYLLRNADRVRTFQQILENVWGWEYQDSVDYIHVYISHLRHKLEADPKKPRYIHTVHGVGYTFVRQSG